MGPKETVPLKTHSDLYTKIKKRLNITPKHPEYHEDSYYKSNKNDVVTGLPHYEMDAKGNLVMTDSERSLAKALYEEVGPKGTISDINATIKFLKSRLNDPLKGFKKDLRSLVTSDDAGLLKPYKGEYDTADNAHKKLVDQLSIYYHRNK